MSLSRNRKSAEESELPLPVRKTERSAFWYATVPTTFALLGLLWLYFVFGIHHIGKFQTSDEDLWFSNPSKGRVHEYWEAIQKGDWARTRINDKPGATTALLSGLLGMKADVPPEAKMIENGNIIDRHDPVRYENAAYSFRLPIFIANGVLILFMFWFSYAMTGSRVTAILLSGGIALSPILIGISQIVNPDATLWSFGFASLLAWFAFLKGIFPKRRTAPEEWPEEKEVLSGCRHIVRRVIKRFIKRSFRSLLRLTWKDIGYASLHFVYLVFSALFLGGALASKYTASFIMFFLPFAAFVFPFFLQERFVDRLDTAKYAIKAIFALAFLIVGGIAVFAVIMPAALLDHKYIYEGTIGFRRAEDVMPIIRIIAVGAASVLFDAIVLRGRVTHSLLRLTRFFRNPIVFATSTTVAGIIVFLLVNWGMNNRFGLADIPFDTGTGKDFRSLDDTQQHFAQWKSLVFTVPPAVLFPALFALAFAPWLRAFRATRRFMTRIELALVFLSSSFILLFYEAVMMQRLLAHVRYGILLYPVVVLLAAVGLSVAFRLLRSVPWRIPRWALVGSLGTAVFFGSLVSLNADRPFYFNYTSSLLPKWFITAGAWGYGGYEAAQELNRLPNAEKLLVWSDYEGFCPFFVGRCIKGSVVKWHKGGTFEGIDYFVVSRRGLMNNKTTWRNLTEKYAVIDKEDPFWSLHIGGRFPNFVEIYRTKDSVREQWVRNWLAKERTRGKRWLPAPDVEFPLSNEAESLIKDDLRYY